MFKRFKIFTFLCCLTAIFTLTIFSVNAQDRLTNKSKVSINSIGPVQVGMNLAQASKVTGLKFVETEARMGSCSQISPKGAPKGVSFLLTNGYITRVDIYENKQITTIRGAKVGDTKTRIMSLYQSQLRESNSEVSASTKLLTFTPTNRNDKNYRLIFEMYQNRVQGFRVGKLPEVEYSEGCA
jgi:hypothetical protein